MTHKKAQNSDVSSCSVVVVETPPTKYQVEPSGALNRMDSISKALVSTKTNTCSTPHEAAYDDGWIYSPQEEGGGVNLFANAHNRSNSGTPIS